MALSAAEYEVMCRHDFYTFMHRAFCELNRDSVFSQTASKLQSCLDGRIRRLIANLPPKDP